MLETYKKFCKEHQGCELIKIDGHFFINSNESVIIKDDELTSDGHFPVIFNIVTNDFICSDCKKLTSLEGAPKIVDYFDCSGCDNLISLIGAPQTVRTFYCSFCVRLMSLEGAPQNGDIFRCKKCPNINYLEKTITRTRLWFNSIKNSYKALFLWTSKQ